MKRILVTGATAPIGEALICKLSAHSEVDRIIAVGREPEPGTALLGLKNVEYMQVDLTRARDIRDLLFSAVRSAEVDTVVHTALHRRAQDEGERVRRLNVEATRALVALCDGHPTIRRFVLRSQGEVYKVRANQPAIITEDHPLNLDPGAPQWIRDRVEADVIACTQMGMGPMKIAVLRCAEVLAPSTGSQLYDYLGSRACFRPMGYDPMINLLSIDDQVSALCRAIRTPDAQGIFNIPGRDTLPLSELIASFGRADVPIFGVLLGPAYRMRRLLRRTDFRYDMNHWRFHFSGVLDGRRAQEILGYVPSRPLRPAELAKHWRT